MSHDPAEQPRSAADRAPESLAEQASKGPAADPSAESPPPSGEEPPETSAQAEAAEESPAGTPADAGETSGADANSADAPPAEPPTADAAAEPPTADGPAAEPPAAADTAAAGESPEQQPGGAEQPAGDSPLAKFNIGSRRGGGAQPQGARPQTSTSAPKPEPPPRRSGPVPVPNIRSSSEELDREVEAALGGSSLEELIQQQDAAAAAAPLELETKVNGTVVKVHGDNVFLMLGGRNEGVVSLRQFSEPPQPGQKLDVVVAGVSRDDGLYEVNVPGAAISVDDWSDLAEGAVVEARVTGSNTGGLECKVNNIRGFIPASQISLFRVENFNEYVDQKLTCVVTEANARKKNLVLSRRAVLEREREQERKKLLEELEVGQVREGVVRNIRDFGAFVDLGGVDGLIHISQLSWERVEHPKEVLSEGEKVQVRVEKIDPQSGKIGLSYRSLQDHPWKGVEQKFPVGSTVAGAVTRLANFGAFVKLAPGVEGLVHVSELAHHRVSLVSSIVKEGDEVSVKVLSVDEDNQRISLSIKQTSEAPKTESKRKEEPEVDATAALPKHQGPLKGGVDKPSGGDQFGLKW